jgi:hypothetical protein
MPDHNNFLTHDEIRDGCITINHENALETRICIAQEELRQGMETAMQYPKSASFYGSARLGAGTPYYELARNIAYRASSELGYAVISGGGPGIMEGANRGAFEAGGISIGMTIHLPHEQFTNPYVTIPVPFYYFYTRKTAMSFASRVYLAFPGGFGTFDEIFELTTLIQTKKIPQIPIILVGVDFWQPFVDMVRSQMLETFATISPDDLCLFTVTDDIDTIIDIMKHAPERTIAKMKIE